MVWIKEKIEKMQKLLGYKFNNEELLVQALTTPQFGHENNIASYDYLEILGDSVIKTAFILKLYQMGIEDPGKITKIKTSLESDEKFKEIATEINLEQYIFKSENQKIEGTRILADIFEAICGAIFVDSEYNLKLIEDKIINRFYEDFGTIIENFNILNTSLLEFLQEKFKTNITIRLDYEKKGYEHEPNWRAKNPRILDKNSQKELLILPNTLQSETFKNKKDAQKDIYIKILEYLKDN